ncbi:MAG: hypothetical protein KAS78_01850, partial [Candidatus Pacebacteria bacterium]|nr:hypothetical protein [Candidatus Paceibacterota bacterium]
MKRIYRLYLTTALFLIFTVCIMIFILKDLNRNYDNFDKSFENSTQNINNNDKIENNKIEKEIDQENINWHPIIEKYKGKEISKVATERKIIALTFDAGANADGTEKILAILK